MIPVSQILAAKILELKNWSDCWPHSSPSAATFGFDHRRPRQAGSKKGVAFAMSRQSRVMSAKMGPSWRPVIGSTKQRVRSTPRAGVDTPEIGRPSLP